MIILLIIIPSILAEIRECYTITDVIDEVVTGDLLPNDTLLLFDLDNTVFMSQQYVGSVWWFDYELRRTSSFSELLNQWEKMQETIPIMTVEPLIVTATSHLHSLGYKMIALTARNSRLNNVTLQQLREVKVTFDDVIYADGKNKGRIYMEYQKQHNLYYNKIIMIDDGRKHLEDMEETLNKKRVSFVGFHYLSSGVK